MKKGFTLVELLAVIVIIGVLALIAIPAVNKSIKQSKEQSHDATINNILRTFDLYSVKHRLGTSSNVKYLEFEDLISAGYLKNQEIIDPLTKEELTGCISYYWSRSHNQYVTDYVSDCSDVDEIEYTDAECFFYENNNDEITIQGFKCYADNEYGLETKTDIAIPKAIEGAFVTTMVEGAFSSYDLTSVIIPNSVTTIESNAFEGNLLTRVTLGTGVTTIGYAAFNRNQLTSVTIPNSVTTIGENAFNNSTLTSITINKATDSITGSPWGATNATVTWTGN